MARLVVDFQDLRPIFRVPERALARIRAAVPAGWDTAVVRTVTEGTADGAGVASAEAVEAVRDAEVYLGFGVPPEILRAGRRLRWVHSGTAGVGGSLTDEMRASDVVFTNSAGIHAVPMAETVIAMLLHFARGIDAALEAQLRGRWDKSWFDRASTPIRELGRSTVGIVGFGGTGRAIAERVRPFGARVIAAKRRPSEPVDGVELVFGEDGLDALLEAADFVVLAVPETPETRGLIDASALARMRPHAVVVNVARGGVVDEAALIDALREGRLRGAALDVFSREPLPSDHPFWRLPNVVVTPHVSAYSHHFWERETALVVENLRRFLAGEPLVNVVDKAAGY